MTQKKNMNKHVPTLTKFAQIEHDHGSIERGRAMFNTLIESNPKRMICNSCMLLKKLKKIMLTKHVIFFKILFHQVWMKKVKSLNANTPSTFQSASKEEEMNADA